MIAAAAHVVHPRMLEVGSVQGVLSAAQWNVMEFHTQNAVGKSYERPEMVSLPAPWSEVREVQKLVDNSDEYEAECGFALCTSSGDQLAVVPGADVYTLAIQAPFHPLPFTPENDLTAYLRKAF